MYNISEDKEENLLLSRKVKEAVCQLLQVMESFRPKYTIKWCFQPISTTTAAAPEVSKEAGRRRQLEELAKQHEAKGIIYQRMPREIYKDMPYTNLPALEKSGATSYRQSSILTLLLKGVIHHFRVGSARIMDPADVDSLLTHEARLKSQPHAGWTPGQKRHVS